MHAPRLAMALAATFSFSIPTQADAKGDQRDVAAIIIELNEDLTRGKVAQLEAFIAQASEFYPQRALLLGTEVRKKFRKTVKGCELDVLCIARIARKRRLTEIIVGRYLKESEQTVQIQFLAISAADREIVRKVPVRGGTLESMRVELARNFFSIVGISTPGYLEIAGSPVDLVIDGKVASTAQGPITLAPGPHEVVYGSATEEVLILPGEIQKLSRESLRLDEQASAPPPVAPSSTTNSPAAANVAANPTPTTGASPLPPEPTVSTEERSRGLMRSPLSYVGIGVAAAGAGLLATSVYFGTQTSASFPSTTPQAEAVRRNQDAQDAAKRANIFLGVGALLVAAGGTLWVLDNFVLEDAPSVHIDPAGDSKSLELQWSW